MDIHTYIHTNANWLCCTISCLTLRRSVITCAGSPEPHMKLTKNAENLSQQTNIPTCQGSHVLITYQTLAYVSCSDRLQFQKWTSCYDMSSYHDIKLHDTRYKILSRVVAVLIREYTEMHKSIQRVCKNILTFASLCLRSCPSGHCLRHGGMYQKGTWVYSGWKRWFLCQSSN